MSAVTKIKLWHVDKDKCEACEKCVVIAGESFSMTEEDGKVFSKFTGKDSSKLKLCLTSCPAHAIIPRNSKSVSHEHELDYDFEKCGACAECVKIAPDSFEIVEKDGRVVSSLKGKDIKNLDHVVLLCENKALTLKKKK